MTSLFPRRHLALTARLLAASLLAPLTVGLAADVVPAAADWSRGAVPLSFAARHPGVAGLLELFIHNARTAALPFLSAVALSALRRQPQTARTVRGPSMPSLL